MRVWIKRHKVFTAFIISLVVVAMFRGIPNADIGGVAELVGLGWGIYIFAWLIWEYPKRRRRGAMKASKTKEQND